MYQSCWCVKGKLIAKLTQTVEIRVFPKIDHSVRECARIVCVEYTIGSVVELNF